jgi:hypothetical protein
MSLRVSKNKLPKTQAYPLKTSFLEKVILESGFEITKIDYIDYLFNQRPDHFFEAHFKGLRIKEFANPGTVDITIYSVPTSVLKQIKSEILPLIENDFKAWLIKLSENKNDLCNESRGFHIWRRDHKLHVIR